MYLCRETERLSGVVKDVDNEIADRYSGFDRWMGMAPHVKNNGPHVDPRSYYPNKARYESI